MEKYDGARICEKCGYGGIEDEYREADQVGFYIGTIPEHAKIPERIARTCKNCGYSWDEKPLDKPLFDAEYKRCWPTKEEIQKWMDTMADIVAPAVGIPAEMLKSRMADDPGGIKATCEMAKPGGEGYKLKAEDIPDCIKKVGIIFALKIEVRDVVETCSRLCNIKRECTVIGIRDEEARMHEESGLCSCVRPISDLTLIRKGLRVHTFEGVTIDTARIENFGLVAWPRRWRV